MADKEDRFIFKYCLTKEELKELTQELADSIVIKKEIAKSPLLSREESWEYLGIGRTKFIELDDAGEFEVLQLVKPNGKRLYPIKTLDNFIERNLNKDL